MKKLVSIVIMILGLCICFQNFDSVLADCKSDCEDQYESKIRLCSSLLSNNDPASLEACMNNAESAYDTCLNECEDENESI